MIKYIIFLLLLFPMVLQADDFENYWDMPCVKPYLDGYILDYNCVFNLHWGWELEENGWVKWTAKSELSLLVDVDGNPLPDSIPSAVHEEVLEAGPMTTYRHWIASGHTIDWLAEQLASYQGATMFWANLYYECSAPPPEPEIPEVDCDVNHSFNNGDLYKPYSDNTGNPVFLIDPKFQHSDDCDVFDKNSNFLLSCKHRRCCANGNRDHWDVPRRCGDLERDDPLVIRLRLDGIKHCWDVLDACTRYE